MGREKPETISALLEKPEEMDVLFNHLQPRWYQETKGIHVLVHRQNCISHQGSWAGGFSKSCVFLAIRGTAENELQGIRISNSFKETFVELILRIT